MIEVGTKNQCQHCGDGIEYRRPIDREGEVVAWTGPYWFHVDDRPEFEPDKDPSRERWGSYKMDCRNSEHARAEPRTICTHELGDGYEPCGRKIPPDNLKEGVYACGIHARKVRERMAYQAANELRRQKEIAEGDLKGWVRQQLSLKVAEIMEAGIKVDWASGDPEGRGSYYDKEPSLYVKVLIEDLLEYVREHHS